MEFQALAQVSLRRLGKAGGKVYQDHAGDRSHTGIHHGLDGDLGREVYIIEADGTALEHL